jgi:hypothetical protein
MTKDELFAKAGTASEFSHDLRVVPIDYALQAAAAINGDKRVLELALREMSLALDAFVAECQDTDGKPKAPSRQLLMRSRGLLPPYCALALAKKDARPPLPG